MTGRDPSRTSTIYFCCDARTWAGWGKPMRRREFITLFGGDPRGHGARAAAGRAGDRLPRPEITRGLDGPSARVSAGAWRERVRGRRQRDSPMCCGRGSGLVGTLDPLQAYRTRWGVDVSRTRINTRIMRNFRLGTLLPTQECVITF